MPATGSGTCGFFGFGARGAVASGLFVLFVGAARSETASTGPAAESADDAHMRLYTETDYPSAHECAVCHPKHFREWSVSPHAYAQISPVFNAMQTTVFKLTNGTNGDFCIRCHTPIGMQMGEPETISNLHRAPISVEGVTCVVCHRINSAYGKVSGRIPIERGDITKTIYGPTGNEEVGRILDHRDKFRVTDDEAEPGRPIHGKAAFFEPISTSGFCGQCHDVNLLNGFRLEEAFSDFKASPASALGIRCQDCHMGRTQGATHGNPADRESFDKANFEHGPAAIVGGVPTRERKITSHVWAGPDHSIVHPGVFPHNTRARQLAELRRWLAFDHEAGWGRERFESGTAGETAFPHEWSRAADRFDAREILDEQEELLDWYDSKRLEVMRNAFAPGEFSVGRTWTGGLKFEKEIRNLTPGHSVATGFDAERVMFLRVTVTDARGEVIFRSGDLDPNGDLRDSHSVYVHNGEVPLDDQLFALQSKFIVRMAVGGDREQILAVNSSQNSLPFIRPGTNSTILSGRPADARIHRNNIDPEGSRTAKYQIPRREMRKAEGPLTLRFEFIQGMVPVNLVNEIRHVGFDWEMTAREVADRIVAGHRVIWSEVIELDPETLDWRQLGDAPPAQELARAGTD